MSKHRGISIAVLVLFIISIAINIFLANDNKDKELIIENMEAQYEQRNDAKLYGVLNNIELDLDFINMSTKEIESALVQNIAYCNSAMYLVDGTRLSDDEGSFGFALQYTKTYLDYLLNNKDMAKTKECSKALEEISEAYYEAIYRNDKKYIKEFERVAKSYADIE